MIESCLTAMVAFCLVCLAAASTRADVTLPSLISDNMVLQQGSACPVWGWAAPGEKVTVAIAGETKAATAGPDGRWQVTLDALAAGGPLEMTVSGSNTVMLC